MVYHTKNCMILAANIWLKSRAAVLQASLQQNVNNYIRYIFFKNSIVVNLQQIF